MEGNKETVCEPDELKGENATAIPLDSDCPICLQKFLHPVRLPCNHVFCYLCCKGEVLKRKRCAMCRSEIPKEYFYDPTLLETAILSRQLALEDGYQWFYEGKNGWWQYDERSSSEIEQNYSKGEKSIEILIAGHLYVINFELMRQHRTNAPGRFRNIKRDLCTVPKKGVAGLMIKRALPNVPDTRPEAEGNETEKSDQAQGVSQSQPNGVIADDAASNANTEQTASTKSNADLPVRDQRSSTDIENGNVLNLKAVNRRDFDDQRSLRTQTDNRNGALNDAVGNGGMADRPSCDSPDSDMSNETNDNDHSITPRVFSEMEPSSPESSNNAPVTRPRIRARRSRTDGTPCSRDPNPSHDQDTPRDQGASQKNSQETVDLMHDPVVGQRRSYSRPQDVEVVRNPNRSSVEIDGQLGDERGLAHALGNVSLKNNDDSNVPGSSSSHSENRRMTRRSRKHSGNRDYV